jgi:hypothetical protein
VRNWITRSVQGLRKARTSAPLVYAAVIALGLSLTPGATAQDAPEDAVGVEDTEGTEGADSVPWENPESRSADPDSGIELDILSQQPAVVTADDALDLQVRVTNTSDQPIDSLQLRTQHQPALDDSSGVATSLMANQGEYPSVGPFQDLDGSVDPGENRTFRLTVPVDGRSGSLSGLGLDGPGVYPLLLNLNATHGENDTSFMAGARSTVTVRDTDGTDDTDDTEDTDSADADDAENTEDTADTGETPDRPSGLTVLWPLSSKATTTPGQVGDAPEPNELYLQDDSLAEELGPDGRLTTLLSSYRDALDGDGGDELREATCIAIDPDLLETVNRMTDGYRVAEAAPSPVEEPVRLRDRWTHDEKKTPSEPGSGADDASDWLEELRDIVDGQCTVPLPHSGTDPNALATVDDPWLTDQSNRGEETIEDILDTSAADGVVVPGSGYLEDETVTRMGEAERTTPLSTLVSDSTVQSTEANPGSTAGVVNLPGGTRAMRFPEALGTALAATGESPSTAPYGDPMSRRDLSEDSSAERMAAAVGVLDLELSGAGSTASGANVVAVPPTEWTVDEEDATTWLTALGSHLSDGSARPVPFGNALRGVAEDGENLSTSNDPNPVTSEDRDSARGLTDDLHRFTQIMVEDENVALTPEIFTRPMFDDVLRSLSTNRRHVSNEARAVVRESSQRRDKVADLAAALRSSVSLLPPGSVFTRTSDGAPLTVVARNGLPLPVRVRVDYEADNDVTLDTPGVQQIPAQGSVTLQLTATADSGGQDTDLTMMLNTPDDQPISEPVTVRLTSGPGGVALAVVVGVAVVFGLFVVSRVTKRRHKLAGKRQRRQ